MALSSIFQITRVILKMLVSTKIVHVEDMFNVTRSKITMRLWTWNKVPQARALSYAPKLGDKCIEMQA